MDRTEAMTQASVDVGALADTDHPSTLAAVQTEADRLMRENNVALPKDSPAYALLCNLVGRGMA